MRVLIVGFSNSIHLVKIVNMLDGLGWDIHVVPSSESEWTTGFDGCSLHHFSLGNEPPEPSPTLRIIDHRPRLRHTVLTDGGRAQVLAEIIDDLRPDIVHSHEFQSGAYLTLAARERCRQPFPAWIVSNWGSDIFFFARNPAHRQIVRRVLGAVDGYWAECARDVALARSEGLRATVLPVLPNAGGYDLPTVRRFRTQGPTSQRTAIAVKGYQHWAGRALNAIDALDLCGGLLYGREIVLYSASDPAVVRAAGRLAAVHGAKLTASAHMPYDEILKMHGRSRVSIGLSISDGVSTSFLEALLGGAFPVQSFTACAAEWVIEGVGGLLVDPTDIRVVAGALRRALSDDALVDRASVVNDAVVDARLDLHAVRAAVVAGYRTIAAQRADSLAVGAGS